MQILRIFNIWFFISIILALIGIILSDLNFVDYPKFNFLIKILANLSQAIGCSIFVGNIFTFILGTNQFISYVREKLINIVLSKEFVTTLNQEEQKKLLKLVLKPKVETSNTYSGINDYFNQYVEDSIMLFDESFRGHMVLDATASFNTEKNRIQVHFDIEYVVYKACAKFDPIPLYLEEEDFEHIRTIIRGPDNVEKILSGEEVKTSNDVSEVPTMKKKYIMEIPDEFNNSNQINISRRIIEYGNDHWQVFSYKTIKACDRLTLILRCEDDIVVRLCHTYGVQQKFSIEKEDKKVKVIFNDWLNPGFGVNILLARENYHKTPEIRIGNKAPDMAPAYQA